MSEHGSVQYEKTDVSVGQVTRASVIVFGTSAVVAVALVGYLTLQVERDERRAAPARAVGFEGGRQAPLPRLQEAPFVDVGALRAEEERALRNFGWVDRQAGVVRLPIDVAMRLYVEREAARRDQTAAPRDPHGPDGGRPAGAAPTSARSGVHP